MELAITADVHVGVPGKLDDIIWALKRMRKICSERGVKTLLILGDLLHDREQIGVDTLNSLVDFLIETDEKYNIRIITFPGNHDMYLKNSWEINSLKPLTRYLETYHEITTIELGGTRFWIVPFIHYESEYMKVMDDIYKKHKKGDVLLTHIGVKSATLNTCFLLKSWSVVDFADSPFDIIFTGHFHVHQQIGHNIWYPGSPIPFRFDEGDTPHGFIIFDTDTRKHQFIDLWDDLDADDNPPPLFTTISDENLRTVKTKDIKGNMVRVALHKEYTHNQLSNIRKALYNIGAKDVRWLNLASKEQIKSMGEAVTAASSKDLFKRFLDNDSDNIKQLNVDILLKLNKQIVDEANELYLEQSDSVAYDSEGDYA